MGPIGAPAEQRGVPIHPHTHETADEIADSLKQHGVRPLERLARLGLLGPNFIGVHAAHLNEAEIDVLATHGCHVAHCPSSNLKLASGCDRRCTFCAIPFARGPSRSVPAGAVIAAIERAMARYEAARLEQHKHNSLLALVATLTPRERQVFDRIVRGKINKAIAHELGTTERTVKAHRHQVMEKMQAHSLAELVLSAERVGMIDASRGSGT